MSDQPEACANADAVALREKRVWIRYPVDREGSCQPLLAGGPAEWSAVIHNLSRGGLLLWTNRRFEPRTLLQVEWRDPDGAGRTLLARVVHAAPRDGGWALGCTFPRALAPDQLQDY